MAELKELLGKIFGRLKVISRYGSDKHHRATWLCKCSCGKETIVNSHNLLHGITKSCGCLSHDKLVNRNKSHGFSKTPIYKIWTGMKKRCLNKNDKRYESYGGRGISVCTEWLQFEVFYNWSVQSGYKDGLQIDRIDNDKGYSPKNCRWVTSLQQACNKRKTLRFPNGVAISSACRMVGIETFISKKNHSTKEYQKISGIFKKYGKLHPIFIEACLDNKVCPHKFLLSH